MHITNHCGTDSINIDFIEKQLVQIQWLKYADSYPLQLIFTAVDAHLFGKGFTVNLMHILKVNS